MEETNNPLFFILFLIASTLALLLCLIAARSALTRERIESRLIAARKSTGLMDVPVLQVTQPEFDGELSARLVILSLKRKLDNLVHNLPFARKTDMEKLHRMLTHANFRSRKALRYLIIAKFLTAFLFAVTAFAIGLLTGINALSTVLVGGLTLGFVGLLLPEMIVGKIAKRRQDRIQASLPNALDLLLLCAEAGLTLTAVLERVANEITRASPDIAQELKLCANELRLSVKREEAFRNLYERTGVTAFRSLALTLIQGEKFGTSLGDSIRTLAAEKRKERMLLTEAKAARLPVKMTFPMLVFFIPPIFIAILGPIFTPFLTDRIGSGLLGE